MNTRKIKSPISVTILKDQTDIVLPLAIMFLAIVISGTILFLVMV
jgi:hypothetical protein